MATKKTKKKAPVYRSNRNESRLAEARVERAAVQVLAGMCAGFGTLRFNSGELYDQAVNDIVSRAIDVTEELIDQLDGVEDEDDEDDEEDDEDDEA